MKKRKLIQKVFLSIALGNLMMPMVGESATTYDKQITGDTATDEANGYDIDDSSGNPVYTFQDGDKVTVTDDKSILPQDGTNKDARVEAVKIGGGKTVLLEENGIDGLTMEATAKGGEVAKTSGSVNANGYAYGIDNGGSITLTGTTNLIVNGTGGKASANVVVPAIATSANAYAYAYGIDNGGGGSTTLDGRTNLTVSAIGGLATSNSATSTGFAQASGVAYGISNNFASTTLTGTTDITVSATGGDAYYASTSTLSDASADAYAQAYGIDNRGGSTTLAGTTDLTVSATGGSATSSSADISRSAFTTVDAEAYGINNSGGGSTTSLTGRTNLTVIAIGGSATSDVARGAGYAYGINNSGGGSTTLTGTTDITVSAIGGTPTSSSANAYASAEAYGIINTSGSTTSLTGRTNLIVSAIGGTATSTYADAYAYADVRAYGIQNYEGSTTLTGTMDLTVSATGGDIFYSTSSAAPDSDRADASAYGIDNEGDTVTATEDSGIVIDVKAVGGKETRNGVKRKGDATAYGIYTAYSGGFTEIKGDLTIRTSAELTDDSAFAGGTGRAYALYGAYDGKIYVNQAGGKTIQLTGDLATEAGWGETEIKVKLDNENSFLTGMVENNAGIIELELSNGARWQPTGTSSNFGTTGSGLTMGNGGILDMAQWHLDANGVNGTNSYRTLSVGGNANLNDGTIYRVNSDVMSGVADQIKFTGTVTASGTHYVQIGYDPSLAAQLDEGTTMISAANPIDVVIGLPGTVIGAGKTSQIDGALFRHEVIPTVSYDGSGKIQLTSIQNVTPRKSLSEGPQTAADAQQAGQNAWMNQGDHLIRRLGDLRLENGDGENGIWARVYTGSNRVKNGSYHRKFDQDYTGMQLGYDRKFETQNGHYYLGGLFDYQTSDPTFLRGNGEVDAYGLGLYGTWVSDKGHYVDVVLRGSQLKNDYSLLDINNNKISAGYDLMSYGISMEYGYRKDLKKNFFVEPQAQLNLGYMGSGNHTLSNGVEISQDSLTTATGRLGILLGKEFGKEEKKGNVYFQTSLIQDFSETPSMYASNNGQRTKIDSIDTKGTSVEFALGTNYKFNNKGKIYLELSKIVGGEVETRWQVNGGMRIMF